MEIEKETIRPEAKQPRAKASRREEEPLPPAREGKGPQWSLVVAGALILALVAFVSGVRLGKSLSDFRPTEASSVRTTPKGLKFSPSRPEVKEAKPGKDAQGLISHPPSPSLPAEKSSAERPSRPAEEAAAPEETQTPAPPKAKFTLQVAALSNPEEARQMVNQLKSKGYAAYQVTGSAAAKGTLYRVRIGQFRSLPEARQFAQAFEKKEKVKTIIASLE